MNGSACGNRRLIDLRTVLALVGKLQQRGFFWLRVDSVSHESLISASIGDLDGERRTRASSGK